MYKTDSRAYDAPIISVRYLRQLVRFLEVRGVHRLAVLEGTGLTVDDLKNPDLYANMNQILQMLRQMRQVLPSELTAFEFGKDLDLCAHGLVGFALLQQENYQTLSQTITQYLRVCLPVMGMAVETNREAVRVTLSDEWELGDLRNDVAKVYLGSIYTLTSLICRKFIFEFDFPTKIANCAWSKSARGAEFRFGGNRNQIIMLLSGAQARDKQDTLAYYMAKSRVKEEVEGGGSTDVVVRIRREIMNSPGRECSLGRVAERVGLTSRAARRYLNAAGFSFQDMRNEARRVYATRYLKDTEMPLEKIANILGYSDQASFTKACRGWTGQTPGEIRRSREPVRECDVVNLV